MAVNERKGSVGLSSFSLREQPAARTNAAPCGLNAGSAAQFGRKQPKTLPVKSCQWGVNEECWLRRDAGRRQQDTPHTSGGESLLHLTHC